MLRYQILCEEHIVILPILGLVLLILISAFFSASETSMMAINRYRTQHNAERGQRTAINILRLLERPDRLLGLILIGNTFANVLASSLTTMIALHYWGDAGILVVSVVLTLTLLIFAEVTPKTLAALHPDATAKTFVFPLKYLLKLAYPLVWAINIMSNGLLAIIGIKQKHKSSHALEREELRSAVSTAAKTVSAQDREMLLGIFDLTHASVNDIMVPRNNIIGIDLDEPIDIIKQTLRSTQHTRIPIYRSNIDNITGILHLRDAIQLLSNPNLNKAMLIKVSQPAYFIPEHVSLVKQLLHFQKNQQRLAFVVNEYGKIEGLIKLDDILEEVVGEFTTDSVELNQMIKKQKDGSYLIDGAIPIRDLNRDLDLDLPIGDAITLNGLIIEHLETLPKNHLSVMIQNCRMEIIEVKDHQIKTVRFKNN